MTDGASGPKRIRLTGERFDGGRLPVDSLVELQRYQNLVRTFALARWQRDNPGTEIPVELSEDVSLTIDRIEDGSADVFLAFEQQAVYAEYQREAEDAVDATLGAAYSGAELPDLPPALSEEIRLGVAEIGSSLEPKQSLEIYVDGPEASPVVVTVETRAIAAERLQLDDFFVIAAEEPAANALAKVEESLVGRITELDADRMRYRAETLQFGPLTGWYKTHPELLEDFRKVVNDVDKAPITRIGGVLQYRNGVPWRMTETTIVEQFKVDNDRWGRELVAFASLRHGWGDGADGKPITFLALEAARSIMQALDEAKKDSPGLFPTSEGGLLLEWSSVEEVHSIEIGGDGGFALFSLPAASFEGVHRDVKSVKDAIAFATGVGA